ncbi:hypothetical protein [Pyxidicoccus caerfyrddinensis]|uniref:hypothetical protein n=1 Tax=Pyxidicoccus caerfyrddinensis TaxID=2709663 RepID=UPI0013DAEAB7|nr:hypothetical protein [Pyxidicoccus caerfyrddinensis]
MANPLIRVNSALYGADTITDVTATIQTYFDQQFADSPGNISTFSFPISLQNLQIPDPEPGVLKHLIITYTILASSSATPFVRAGHDGDTLLLTVAPLYGFTNISAFYGAFGQAIDITDKVTAYFADPGSSNTLTIGSDAFWLAFTNGVDPYPGVQKFFYISFTDAAGDSIRYSAVDFQSLTFGTDDAYPNKFWMNKLSATPAFGNLKLSQICLPATHDTGTFILQDKLIVDPDSPWMAQAMNIVQSFNDQVNVIRYISEFINPVTWAAKAIYQTTRDFATATTSPVSKQMLDGIRCFDFRVYYNHDDPDNPFYTYHSLLGLPLVNALSEINAFATYTPGSSGEIIYLTIGHYEDEQNKEGNYKFTEAQKDQLFQMINKTMDANHVFAPPGDGKSLFDHTYNDITGSSTMSRVILVVEDAPPASIFWDSSYSPVDQGSMVASAYSETDKVAEMVSAQQQCAKGETAKPFALSISLMPDKKIVISQIASSLKTTIVVTCAWLVLIPVIGISVSAALMAIVTSYLAGFILEETSIKYKSLRSLAGTVFAGTDLKTFIEINFINPEYKVPSFIYMDFYEDATETNADGNTVYSLVEEAKKITQAAIHP